MNLWHDIAPARVRPEEVVERVETKRLDPSAQFALISAKEAWADAGAPEVEPERIGVEYSTGIGGPEPALASGGRERVKSQPQR